MLKFIIHARISLDISIHDGVSYANLDLNYISNHSVYMFILDSIHISKRSSSLLKNKNEKERDQILFHAQ